MQNKDVSKNFSQAVKPILYAAAITEIPDSDQVQLVLITNEQSVTGERKFDTDLQTARDNINALLDTQNETNFLLLSHDADREQLRTKKGTIYLINTDQVNVIEADAKWQKEIILFFPTCHYINEKASVLGGRGISVFPERTLDNSTKRCLDMAQTIAAHCPGFTGMRGKQSAVYAAADSFMPEKMSWWWRTARYAFAHKNEDGSSHGYTEGPLDFTYPWEARNALNKLKDDMVSIKAGSRHSHVPGVNPGFS